MKFPSQRPNQITKNQAGFTLIEVVILIFLFSILLVGLLNIFDWQNKIYNLEQADILATGSARTAMNSLTVNIAQGNQIEASRTINGNLYTTGGGTLVLQLPSFDSSGNVLTGIYDYVVYYSSGTSLYQLIELGSGSVRAPSGTKLLSDRLENFALTYNNGNPTLASQVTINLTTRSYYRGSNSVTANLSETIFLRNR